MFSKIRNWCNSSLCVGFRSLCTPAHLTQCVPKRDWMHCTHVEMIRDGYILVCAHHFYQRINNCWQKTWVITIWMNPIWITSLVTFGFPYATSATHAKVDYAVQWWHHNVQFMFKECIVVHDCMIRKLYNNQIFSQIWLVSLCVMCLG